MKEAERQRIMTRIVAWTLDSDAPMIFTSVGTYCLFCRMAATLLWYSPWLQPNHADSCLVHDIAKLREDVRKPRRKVKP